MSPTRKKKGLFNKHLLDPSHSLQNIDRISDVLDGDAVSSGLWQVNPKKWPERRIIYLFIYLLFLWFQWCWRFGASVPLFSTSGWILWGEKNNKFKVIQKRKKKKKFTSCPADFFFSSSSHETKITKWKLCVEERGQFQILTSACDNKSRLQKFNDPSWITQKSHIPFFSYWTQRRVHVQYWSPFTVIPLCNVLRLSSQT